MCNVFDTEPDLIFPAYLEPKPAAEIWLIGLHSTPLFDIDLIIIAFFPSDPRPRPCWAIRRGKSWFVRRVLQIPIQSTLLQTRKYEQQKMKQKVSSYISCTADAIVVFMKLFLKIYIF